MQNHPRTHSGFPSMNRALVAMLIGLAALNPGVRAAPTDISNTPLATTSDISAKPNVMFILDDSGSMASAFMPDDMRDTTAYGFKSKQCNGIAYNPDYDYSANRPLNPDGTPYPAASFQYAPIDGFQVTVTNSKNLNTPVSIGTGDRTFSVSNGAWDSFTKDSRVGIVNTANDTQWMVGIVKSWNNPTLVVTVTGMAGGGSPTATWKVGVQTNVTNLNGRTYYDYTGSKPAMGWKYTIDGLDTIGDDGFANECFLRPPASAPFTQVTVNTDSAQAQRYADWYAYYRTRVLMMRSAAGRAFSPIDGKYRVGFTTISSTSAAPSTKFLPTGAFENSQKTSFYSNLYKADPGNATPLRGALSKVGRYFANKAPGQTTDPMEYACQRNYSILSTDGYWNNNDETSTYGPFKLDGTSVGQQDGTEAKPYWDGMDSVVTTVRPYTVSRTQDSAYDKTTTTISGTTPVSTYVGCGGSRREYTTTATQTTRTLVQTLTSHQTLTGTYSTTQKRINGVDGAVTASTTVWSTPTTTGTDTVTKSDTTVGPALNSVTGTCKNWPYNIPSLPTSSVSNGAATISAVVDNTVAGTPTVTSATAEGSSNSLADVAQYFYVTDLRTSALGNCLGALGTDVCNNEVTPNGLDKAETQHMTTFTLGLGMNGILPYRKDYLNASLRTGSYYELSRADGTLEWPISEVASEGVTHVDDLWHAAVNGRGQYWSASDPSAVSEAIGAALSNVERTDGASSSAATSSLKPVKGTDNQVFVAKYTTVAWTGELVAYSLNGDTGEINTSVEIWNAKKEIAKLNPADRNIYYAQPGATTPTRRDFNYTNLSADGLGGHFTNYCGKPLTPTQCNNLDADPKVQANLGANLVNFLRGDATLSSYNYTDGTESKTAVVYRARESMLGDVINASPVYVSKPPFHYVDTGYSEFVSTHANRRPVVFSAANDGMLHAFAATTTTGTGAVSAGTELWSFIPTAVMPELYRLADTNYADRHHFFVDGTPTVGDIRVGSTWKTILVGGLNAGGKSYYALDITNPLDPKILWEFTDANMGLTYGTPIITKRANGTWVVVLTSGYNNTTGDGNGRLYVLDANTGRPVSDIPNGIPTMTSGTTPAGTSATPSGLGKLNAWIEDNTDNTSTRFYGGDMLGNLWRFDIDNLVEPHGKAMLLATFQINSSTPQPITTRPETAVVTYDSVSYPVILVATGRYLGLGDIVDTTTQSIYAVKDSLATTGLGDVRQRTDMVTQTLTNATTKTRTASKNAVNWATQKGWRVDLPTSGERVSVDMQLQYTTLAAISAIPGSSVCSPSGGSGWNYTFDISTGSAPSSATGNVVGTSLDKFLGVGLTWIELTNGKSLLIIPGSNAKITTSSPPTTSTSAATGANRTSWRELLN
ncbi:MAG: PilC/PilY family type IV pilus protein [Aquabacterium sp.]|uniref:pilus assembly protein n=1 Tax=Aquabacterium sp. TaxID=1872578 RepID=UPI0027231228|nr:PilC/PilY family type IV pilus protein [Aquabacterium sp.]MDO9001897.1 PilC/PilY family type IV pilus protein [Aquabacterium sp.]